MRTLKTAFVIWMTLTLGGMIAKAAHSPSRATAEVGQPTVSGVDKEYKHGKWCIDSRSF